MAMAVRMGMGAGGMIGDVPGVAVGVEMHLIRTVAMHMEVNAGLDQHIDEAPAQQHQHHAHREFEPARQPLVQRQLQRIDGTPEGAECRGMAQPPQRAMADDGAETLLVRGDRGHGGDVVGLQRVLQSEQEAEENPGEHGPSYSGSRAGPRGLFTAGCFWSPATAEAGAFPRRPFCYQVPSLRRSTDR